MAKRGSPSTPPDYFYELKLDGVRGLAYLGSATELRNKRSLNVSGAYPEPAQLHLQVARSCFLDGEIAAIINRGWRASPPSEREAAITLGSGPKTG